jgi:hypothetical protein
MPTIAGEPVTLAEVKGTLSMLRYYRAFLRSDPRKYGECARITVGVRSARDALFLGQTMDRDETRRWLGYIVNMAINRKAGIPDEGRRKRDPDYQIRLRRDCAYIRNWLNHRMRFYSLETPEMRKRYGHLVARYDE